MNKFIVVTTINGETEAIKKFSVLFSDWQIIIVGDKKTPSVASRNNITFLSLEAQKKMNFSLIPSVPENSYCRKNLGYLYAIAQGADIIYEFDDDNMPHNHWHVPDFNAGLLVASESKFLNIYKYFTSEHIWPRGLPLSAIGTGDNISPIRKDGIKIGFWQGIADNDPDVDAVYRLVIDKKIIFDKKPAVAIDKHVYVPSNTQSTAWSRKFFACMYFPMSIPWRFADILRGYIAQRILWESGHHMGYMPATVYQERTRSDYMKDFADEVECHLKIESAVDMLDSLKLSGNPFKDLPAVYSKFVVENIVPEQEKRFVADWLQDVSRSVK